jgi:hypothetical protein
MMVDHLHWPAELRGIPATADLHLSIGTKSGIMLSNDPLNTSPPSLWIAATSMLFFLVPLRMDGSFTATWRFVLAWWVVPTTVRDSVSAISELVFTKREFQTINWWNIGRRTMITISTTLLACKLDGIFPEHLPWAVVFSPIFLYAIAFVWFEPFCGVAASSLLMLSAVLDGRLIVSLPWQAPIVLAPSLLYLILEMVRSCRPVG